MTKLWNEMPMRSSCILKYVLWWRKVTCVHPNSYRFFFYSPERVRKTTPKKHIRGNDIKMGGSLRTIFTADCPVLLTFVAPLTESTKWTRDSRFCSIFNDDRDDDDSLLLQNTGPYYTALYTTYIHDAQRKFTCDTKSLETTTSTTLSSSATGG